MRLLRPLLLLACVLPLGCAGVEPFDPPVAGEMNPGPGLLSGPSGELVLFRRGGAWDAPPEEAGREAPPLRDLTLPPPE